MSHPITSNPKEEIPSPTPNSPTHIEIPESCLPLRKRVHFASPTPSREVGEKRLGSIDYGIITATWDDLGRKPTMDCTDHRKGGSQRSPIKLHYEERLPRIYTAARDATPKMAMIAILQNGCQKPVRGCSVNALPDFLKCQPLNFKGTEGVIGLTQWFEKEESIYSHKQLYISMPSQVLATVPCKDMLLHGEFPRKDHTHEALMQFQWRHEEEDEQQIQPAKGAKL
ncbi:hypothetical protein Tco_0552781 [Tanacetum coccineum]